MTGTLVKLMTGYPDSYFDRFVELVRRSDRVYATFSTPQLKEWLAGTDGYPEGEVVALLWMPTSGNVQATDAELALLLRVDKSPALQVAMLGWSPRKFWTDPLLARLDATIDTILEIGRSLLGEAPLPIEANWPHRIDNLQVQMLYTRAYLRSKEDPDPDNYFQLESEEDRGDARCVRFTIF